MKIEREQRTEWHTKSLPLAIFIRYCEGDESHVATTRSERGCFFRFINPYRCKELSDQFFGEEPVAIGDVRTLLDIEKAIRVTIRACDESAEKVWEAE
jgi:hypothetical protein